MKFLVFLIKRIEEEHKMVGHVAERKQFGHICICRREEVNIDIGIVGKVAASVDVGSNVE